MKNFMKVFISSAAVFALLVSCAHVSGSQVGQGALNQGQEEIQLCYVPAEWEIS